MTLPSNWRTTYDIRADAQIWSNTDIRVKWLVSPENGHIVFNYDEYGDDDEVMLFGTNEEEAARTFLQRAFNVSL